jgi:hypothetical protein
MMMKTIMQILMDYAEREGLIEENPEPMPPVIEQTTVPDPEFWIATAYHPWQTDKMTSNQNHIITRDGFDKGRLKRKPGDVLCRPTHNFWGLYGDDYGKPTCKRCIDLARRYKLAEDLLEDES